MNQSSHLNFIPLKPKVDIKNAVMKPQVDCGSLGRRYIADYGERLMRCGADLHESLTCNRLSEARLTPRQAEVEARQPQAGRRKA
jgi:hypothetical protein